MYMYMYMHVHVFTTQSVLVHNPHIHTGSTHLTGLREGVVHVVHLYEQVW